MTNVEMNDTAAAVTQQGATVASEKASPTKGARHKKDAPKAAKRVHKAKNRDKAAATTKEAKAGKKGAAKPERRAKATTPRAASKGAQILEMIGRAKGATLAEIMTATEWQAHSVRGFISTAGKKHDVKIESSKNEAGERVYTIAN